jgi:hypothetical protein
MAAKQIMEQSLLLGSKFSIGKNSRLLLGNSLANAPAATDMNVTEEQRFLHGPYLNVISKGQG